MPQTPAPVLVLFETSRWVAGKKATSLVQSFEANEAAARRTLAHYKPFGYKMQLVGYTAAGVGYLVAGY